MFLLKKLTNFCTYKKVFTSDRCLFAISSSCVEIFSLSLEYLLTVNIMDLIIDAFLKDNLYILTPSNVQILYVNNKLINNEILHSFNEIFDKIISYKNKFLLYNNKMLCFYNKKFELEYKIFLKSNDLITLNNQIYVLLDKKICCYEYFFKLLLNKESNIQIKMLNLNDSTKSVKRLIFYDDILFEIDGYNFHYVYDNFLFLANNNFKKFKYDGNLVEIEDEIDFISQCGRYVIYKDQIKFIEDFDKIEKITDKSIEIVKNVDLENIKNIKFKRGECLCKSEKKNIYNFTLQKDIILTDKFFIICKDLLKYYDFNNILVLVSKNLFFIYNMDLKIKYVGQYQYSVIFLFTNKFVYYLFNGMYYILDLESEKKFRYLKKDIKAIEQIKNYIITYGSDILRIYKINEKKYSRIFIHEKNKTNDINNVKIDEILNNHNCISFYKKKDRLILGFENVIKILIISDFDKIMDTFKIDGIPLQILPYDDCLFINIKNKGIYRYKSGKFISRDPIDRNIKKFYVYDNKILINDQLQYLTVCTLEFDILGVVYINEYIINFFVQNKKMYFMTEIGNIYKLKESDKSEDCNYFKKHIKINFVVSM